MLNTSKVVLVLMSVVGWIFACVLGILACMLAANARKHDVPWQILGAVVLGLMLASIPVGITLFAAFRAFGLRAFGAELWPKTPGSLSNSIPPKRLGKPVNGRWIAVIGLCFLEALVLPLTIIAAAAEDATLMLSLPVNAAVLTACLILACWPYWRRASIGLCTIHLIGLAIATICAAIEIESVIVSGSLLFITSVALAILGGAPKATHRLFALSTTLFITCSFLIIAIGNVSPNAADAPLFSALVAYQFVFVPLGLLALYHALSRSQQKPITRLQFGLQEILGAMALVCLAVTAAKFAFSVRGDFQIAVATGLAALNMLGVVGVLTTAILARRSDASPSLQKSKAAC